MTTCIKQRRPMFGFILTAFLLFLSACGRDTAPEPTPTPAQEIVSDEPIVIVSMGDSLTEGFGLDPDEAYPAQLERRLLENGLNVRVVNAGISGETSSGALERVDWVMKLEPDIVILETGPNDGLRGLDPALTEQNVNDLVRTFQEQGVVVVLAGMQIVRNMGEEYVEAFQAIYPRVAEQYGVILIPFFLDGVGGIQELNQPDAIHPTADGYIIVVDNIYPYVVKALQSLD